MEDSPHFNAGHGAALNEAAEHELDASIMDGARWRPAPSARCGAYAIRCSPRVPCSTAADAVLLAGAAADDFAAEPGTGHGRARLFHDTQRRVEALRVLKARAAAGNCDGIVGSRETWHRRRGRARPARASRRRNVDGRLQQQAFRPRRGQSDHRRRDLRARWRLRGVLHRAGRNLHAARRRLRSCRKDRCTAGKALEEAANALVFDTLASHGIGAGLVALGATGNPVAPFNTLGMSRGWISTDGELTVATHRELHALGPA